MAEADYGMTQMAFEQPDNINPEDYAGMMVKFLWHPHKNQKKSKEEGRPIYDEVEYVDIRAPGNRKSHQLRPAAQIDIQRWPKHYEAFKSRTTVPETGTPLEEWPAINRAMVEELKFFHVNTVEQLSELNDQACQKFMGVRAWKDRATAYLAATGESKAAEALDARFKEQGDQIADLIAANEAMAAKLAESEEE